MNKKIYDTAIRLGVREENIELCGQNIAKISAPGNRVNSKLILVTATSSTPFGEGKTTTSIALADAFQLLKQSVALSLREPSLGPVFGMKGGATGGGLASLENAENINLHFSGDFHAITSANNLIASILDNSIYQGNDLNINVNKVYIKRCMDINDCALRHVKLHDREELFVITAASDMMAIFSMCKNLEDLRYRIAHMVIAENMNGDYLLVKDLECVDATLSLLVRAIKPNLVNTLVGTPAFVHGGPFANIALGCSSVIATSMAQSYAEYVITEAGFGSDLGAEKFIDIQSRLNNFPIDCVVMVTTIRSLQHNGDGDVRIGIQNLEKHIHTMREVFNLSVVVALNRFTHDKEQDIDFVKSYFDKEYCKVILCEPYTKGGEGAKDLAKEVMDIIDKNDKEKQNKEEGKTRKSNYAYELDSTIQEKINAVAIKVYGAGTVLYSEEAKKSIAHFALGEYAKLPVCIAKTQYSFSDDANLLGAASGFDFKIREVKLNSGAGFFVVIAGDVMIMPGLGKDSRYKKIKVDSNGNVEGMM